MRIDTSNRTTGVGRGNAAGRSGSGVAFVPAGEDGPVRVAASAPAQAMTGIDAILALQAAEGPLTGRKKAVRRGASLLDSLEEMRTDLLIGRVDPERLDRMSAMLAEVRERSLPGLDALLDDIELRVRVELAKAGRYLPG
ncbi:flagellar assembly protein FliX [Devosia oryziradicis]|uniref:Flagellar assembly protein FliX n=1 Tax=Devosia oryziradicis TaxID=2801335 RepID=A0ABX7BSY2_9HYPH|nr:flagellar assembly protein FliX [Devosia oryziradicis]QQR34663.1 flagellar assembly protein FliX [Devosia oryziradicis]